MPNWCNNSVSLYHEDKAMIERASKALADGKLLEEFIPIPEALKETTSPAPENAPSVEYNGTEYTDWYSFCVNEWGTKWDVDGYSNEVTEDGHRLECSFDSAWSPPVAAFEKLKDLGFYVEATYYEPGVGFCGEWSDGNDWTYEIPGTSDEVKEQIPEHIDAAFAISESMADWESEQENEEE